MKRGKTVTDQNEERINNLGHNAERGMEIVARSLELLARQGLTFPSPKATVIFGLQRQHPTLAIEIPYNSIQI